MSEELYAGVRYKPVEPKEFDKEWVEDFLGIELDAREWALVHFGYEIGKATERANSTGEPVFVNHEEDVKAIRQRANPETCLHNVIRYEPGLGIHICVSCDTHITHDMWLKKNYQIDIRNNLWVHEPKPSSELPRHWPK